MRFVDNARACIEHDDHLWIPNGDAYEIIRCSADREATARRLCLENTDGRYGCWISLEEARRRMRWK